MSKIAGRLFILACIDGYTIKFEQEPVQIKPLKDPMIKKTDGPFMEEVIENMLAIGAIKKCHPARGHFSSTYFLVPKSDGRWRFVLNSKRLNKFIKTDHFKMKDMRSALRLIEKNLYMATLDLQDAYYLVSVNVNGRKYLRFEWNNQIYEFQCLVFGLA